MNWGFNTNIGGFEIYIEGIHFEQAKVWQQLYEFDEVLFKSGYKYSIFEVVRQDKYVDFFNSLKSNVTSKNEDLEKGRRVDKKEFLIASFLKDIEGLGFPRSKLITRNEGKEWIEKYYSRQEVFKSPLYLDREMISFSADKAVCTYLTIISECDIWFEKVIEKKNFKWVDNRSIAYRNTPRFNSFFREVCEIAAKNGGYIEIDEPGLYKEYITPYGILLDGKIIYQEDIDEGRIQLPE